MSDEALRLLERLTTDEAMHYPVDFGNPGYPGDEGVKVDGALHCDYCDANVDSDGPHKDDCPWAEARTLLANIPETAAREAAAERELTKQRDHWRAALVAFEGNDTVDIDYSLALRMESDLTRFLADRSPAAAALLARGERHKAALEEIEALPVNQALVRRIEVEARAIARAALAPG